MKTVEELNPRVGLLGELAVEMQIVQHGWHPVRLDTAQMASNADLIAVNRRRRVSIQVKTTSAETQHYGDVAGWLSFGYSTGYLRDKKPIFNAKNSPLIADIVIAVSYHAQKARFVIMPVAFAEKLCCIFCDGWYSVPTQAGKKRSMLFPIYLPFTANLQDRMGRRLLERMKRNVLKFEDAWNVLSEDVDKLHDPKKWPLLR
ncbi:MAG: hypothetical protein WB341_07470 [Terracidiphilus sp.]